MASSWQRLTKVMTVAAMLLRTSLVLVRALPVRRLSRNDTRELVRVGARRRSATKRVSSCN